MKTLEFTIAGGWWWCDRCQKHHVECSPCPKDPNYVPLDPDKLKKRFDAAVDAIRLSEGNYQCICANCNKIFHTNNKREILCGKC